MDEPVRRRQWVQAAILVLGIGAVVFPFAGGTGIAAGFWCALGCAGLWRWRRGWPFTARWMFHRELTLDLLTRPTDEDAADPPE